MCCSFLYLSPYSEFTISIHCFASKIATSLAGSFFKFALIFDTSSRQFFSNNSFSCERDSNSRWKLAHCFNSSGDNTFPAHVFSSSCVIRYASMVLIMDSHERDLLFLQSDKML